MTASEVLEQWGEGTPSEDRKEIFETLMEVPEFGRFLKLLEEYKWNRYLEAQNASDPMIIQRYLGSAQAVDDVINLMREDLAESFAVLPPS